MSPHGLSHADEIVSFPRVSGDEPGVLPCSLFPVPFSPRERG